MQDLWIKKVVAKRCKGQVLFRRYADDSVVCFEREDDAQAYLRALPKRLEKFGLQLAEEKSSLVKFNRWEPDDSGKFTFLGFDFYWARTKRNPKTMVVKRRTNRKKFQASVLALKEWIKRARSLKLRELLTALRRKLQGYWNYYGVLGNSMMTSKFQYAVHHLLFKWLNRRSQRRSMTWSCFTRRLPDWKLPPPRVIETFPTKACRGRNKTGQRRFKTGLRDGTKPDFCFLWTQMTGDLRLGEEHHVSSAGYGSAGEQPERRASPKGLVPPDRVLAQCLHAVLIPQPASPLAACEKLRRFGGGASKDAAGKTGARQVNQGMLAA